MAVSAHAVEIVDLAATSLRDLNQRLHDVAGDDPAIRSWRVLNPNGMHAVACGIDAPIDVEIVGHVGYYCAGMSQRATVHVRGNAGTGLAENMMSGLVTVDGNASQSAGRESIVNATPTSPHRTRSQERAAKCRPPASAGAQRRGARPPCRAQR